MSLDTLKKKSARKALGRGLSALISTPAVPIHEQTSDSAVAFSDYSSLARELTPQIVEQKEERGYSLILLKSIRNNPSQPRRYFGEAELRELAESITSLGVLQPILVRPIRESGGTDYEIVAGERRWRAAALAGIEKVPAIIREITDRESLEAALVENVQRHDLNPVEEAQAYQRLVQEYSLTQQEVSQRVGKDRASVANYIRLLTLPEDVVNLVKAGSLSMGHAKAILTVREPAVQKRLAKKVVDEQLSVRKLEEIVSRTVVLDSKRGTRMTAAQRCFPEVTDRLRQSLGTKVNIKHHRSGRGKIEISYFSEEELDRLVELLSE